MGRLEELEKRLSEYKKIVTDTEKIINNLKVSEAHSILGQNKFILGIDYSSKTLVVSDIDDSLQKFKNKGWVIQTSLI